MHIFGYIQHDLLSLLGGLYPMSEAIPNDTKVINAIDGERKLQAQIFALCAGNKQQPIFTFVSVEY